MLVVCVGAFSFSIYYYQKSLTQLNDIITEKDDNVRALSREVTVLTNNLANLDEMLSIQLIREENLSTMYSGLLSEKVTIEEQRRDIQISLNTTRADLNRAMFEIEMLKRDLSSYLESQESQNETISDLLYDINIICDSASSLNISRCGKYT
jgi:chromosome segregation ATPase